MHNYTINDYIQSLTKTYWHNYHVPEFIPVGTRKIYVNICLLITASQNLELHRRFIRSRNDLMWNVSGRNQKTTNVRGGIPRTPTTTSELWWKLKDCSQTCVEVESRLICEDEKESANVFFPNPFRWRRLFVWVFRVVLTGQPPDSELIEHDACLKL